MSMYLLKKHNSTDGKIEKIAYGTKNTNNSDKISDRFRVNTKRFY